MARRSLPLEVIDLIASYVSDQATLSSIALCARNSWVVVTNARFAAARITSAKSLVQLCRLIGRRPSLAQRIRSLVFDCGQQEGRLNSMRLRGLIRVVEKALAQCSKLNTLQFIRAPSLDFILVVCDLHAALDRVDSIEFGSEDVNVEPHMFNYENYERFFQEGTFKLLVASLSPISSLVFHAPVPRSYLRETMNTVRFLSPLTSFHVATHLVDLGVIQEVTLQPTAGSDSDRLALSATRSLSDLVVSGAFRQDPYCASSSFFKDIVAILPRLPGLRSLYIRLPEHLNQQSKHWATDPIVFVQEQQFLSLISNNTVITEVVFPSGNRWTTWIDLSIGDGMMRWEPALLDSDGRTATKTPLHDWWWSSDASITLTEEVIATSFSLHGIKLDKLRPTKVPRPPTPVVYYGMGLISPLTSTPSRVMSPNSNVEMPGVMVAGRCDDLSDDDDSGELMNIVCEDDDFRFQLGFLDDEAHELLGKEIELLESRQHARLRMMQVNRASDEEADSESEGALDSEQEDEIRSRSPIRPPSRLSHRSPRPFGVEMEDLEGEKCRAYRGMGLPSRPPPASTHSYASNFFADDGSEPLRDASNYPPLGPDVQESDDELEGLSFTSDRTLSGLFSASLGQSLSLVNVAQRRMALVA